MLELLGNQYPKRCGNFHNSHWWLISPYPQYPVIAFLTNKLQGCLHSFSTPLPTKPDGLWISHSLIAWHNDLDRFIVFLTEVDHFVFTFLLVTILAKAWFFWGNFEISNKKGLGRGRMEINFGSILLPIWVCFWFVYSIGFCLAFWKEVR